MGVFANLQKIQLVKVENVVHGGTVIFSTRSPWSRQKISCSFQRQKTSQAECVTRFSAPHPGRYVGAETFGFRHDRNRVRKPRLNSSEHQPPLCARL